MVLENEVHCQETKADMSKVQLMQGDNLFWPSSLVNNYISSVVSHTSRKCKHASYIHKPIFLHLYIPQGQTEGICSEM